VKESAILELGKADRETKAKNSDRTGNLLTCVFQFFDSANASVKILETFSKKFTALAFRFSTRPDKSFCIFSTPNPDQFCSNFLTMAQRCDAGSAWHLFCREERRW
jgi:hypothetical protein